MAFQISTAASIGAAISSFGFCRDGCSRSHQGNDLFARAGTPVVAVEDGHDDGRVGPGVVLGAVRYAAAHPAAVGGLGRGAASRAAHVRRMPVGQRGRRGEQSRVDPVEALADPEAHLISMGGPDLHGDLATAVLEANDADTKAAYARGVQACAEAWQKYATKLRAKRE